LGAVALPSGAEQLPQTLTPDPFLFLASITISVIFTADVPACLFPSIKAQCHNEKERFKPQNTSLGLISKRKYIYANCIKGVQLKDIACKCTGGRRELIDTCWRLGSLSPPVSIGQLNNFCGNNGNNEARRTSKSEQAKTNDKRSPYTHNISQHYFTTFFTEN
jgi:hypothetical protein